MNGNKKKVKKIVITPRQGGVIMYRTLIPLRPKLSKETGAMEKKEKNA